MAHLPAGTVTFLFSDVEGSTKLWQAHPEAMQTALARLLKLIEPEGIIKDDNYAIPCWKFGEKR